MCDPPTDNHSGTGIGIQPSFVFLCVNIQPTSILKDIVLIAQQGFVVKSFCHDKADCPNTIGSFQCICQNGYSEAMGPFARVMQTWVENIFFLAKCQLKTPVFKNTQVLNNLKSF